ncbi:hypothetical protein ES705_31271 [subsurface metagenome]|jgi:hypothetical protein
MSRGLGKVERKVLKAVKKGKCEPTVITCFVFGLLDEVGDIIERPSMAQHKSVLRAINRLANKNLLKVARVKVRQYRRRLLENAAWEPYPFPSQKKLIAFCKSPPRHALEIKVNGRTVYGHYWSAESRARLLQRYLSVESREYVPNPQHLKE